MVDIDERVVQMKFDASDFDQNTKKTMSTLDKLREKLSFKDVVDNDAMNSIADNVQKVADKAYTIVDRVIDKIKDNIANKLVNFIQDNTIGQLNAGWNKYADMTTSVATLTGQGYGLKQINEQLERLMYFTDETSFKFTDMVGEIGKFTASGQSLEDATTAMMGIAEWAALSGKNANEASRAMYQLSQALGAGQMRLIDWKSIQNLNMDTMEFRQNAIDAAIAVGTLKDNLDGTYTTLVGKKKGSLSFNIREFSDKLTEGAWFTTEVMMEVYSKYSEAVDDIRDVYEKGYYFDTNNKYIAINTTAEAVREIKKSNNELIKRFANEDEEGLKLTSDQINNILLKWKQVAKVVNHVNELDEEGNKIISDEEAAKAPEMYAEYLKEYSQIFQGTEEDARKALQDWEKYVAEFGMKAFEKSFEAKTFVEAIESAKDAASTVWVQIYQDIFGDYDQAKEIWTDLANTLYELFVNRLWDLQENIIGHWKTGGLSTLKKLKTEYKAQIEELRNSTEFGEEEAEQVRILEAEIAKLQYQIDNGTFKDGRKIFMQGIYGFGSGLKSVIMNFRDGWDSLFTTGETGDKLISWSERLRVAGFKFYLMMQDLAGGKDHEGPSPFYVNLAQGIKNLFAPINALRQIIKSVVAQFLPSGETFISTLTKLSEGFVKLTSKIVPSQETILNIARILRGVVAFVKLIGKAFLGLYNSLLKPIIIAIYTAIHDIVSLLLSALADIADELYYFEEGLNYMESMKVVGEAIGKVLKVIWNGLIAILGVILKIFAPVIGVIYRTIKAIVSSIKELFAGGTGNAFDNISKKLDDLANRAKNAWTSVNSLKDVFNHYSDQKGLPAFLMMITDMLDTLITKIGVTIAALFGLDEAVANGKMSKGLQTLRDIIADIAIGIKWLYTNVIRPILGTLIEGLGNSLHTLGEQWRTGDLKGFLGTIRQIIGTFTSLGLLKFVGTINKVFGAGGLLRVFRNAAKALKGLNRWLGAKAVNEIAGGVLKLAFAFAVLAGSAAALSFLPEKNMSKFNQILIEFGAALFVVLGALFAITLVADHSKWGLMGLASAMIGIVAVVGIFIYAISKLHSALNNLFAVEEEYEETDENGNTVTKTRKREPTTQEFWARLLSLITPVLATIASIAGIMALVRRLGGGATLVQMALTIAGIGAGAYLLVNAIDDLLDIFSRNDTDLVAKITGATVYILGVFAILALITRLLTNPAGLGSDSMASLGKSVTGALTLCLTIAGIALVVRGVLIPTLETLVDSGYNFGDYVAALVIIAGGMFTIAGTMALMNRGVGGVLQRLGNGIVFILFAKVIQSTVVPLIETFTNMGINGNTVAALALVGITMYILTRTINGIFTSLATLLRAIGTLKAKQLVPIIVSIGGVIAGIMLLGSYIKQNGSMMNIEEVGLILAGVGGIVLLLGLFAIMLNREFKGTNLKNFSKLLITLTALVGVTGLAIGGLIFELNKLFGNDIRSAVITLLSVALAMILIIGGSLQAFANAISQISLAFTGLTPGRIKQVRNMFIILFSAIAGIMLSLSLGMVLVQSVYKDNTTHLITTFLLLILGTLALVTMSMNMMEAVITNLALAVTPLTGGKTGKIHQIEVILATTFIGIAAIMGVMALGTALIGATVGGYTWQALFPIAGMVAGTILAFKFIIADVERLALVLSNVKPAVLKETKSILLLLLLSIGTMFVILGGATVGIADALQGYTWESMAPALGIAIGAVIAFTGIANAFNKLAITLSTVASFNLKNIIATMTTILIITGLMATIMTALMNWLAGNGLGGEQNLMNAAAIILAVIVPFAALLGLVNAAAPAASTFVTAAAKISAGIFLIAAALSILAGSVMLIKDAFNIGQNISEGVAEGIDSNKNVAVKSVNGLTKDVNEAGAEGFKTHSPSEVFAKDGLYIDQGLAQGIKKNTSVATKAVTALATATNTAFQKELKIASPSKVFYENGKFVIRGFINGANSEMQKQKDLGAAMGEGFAESAKAGMEDTWAGLWDGQEMKDWIDNFSKEGGLNFGTEAGKSLFSAFLGEESDDEGELKKQLSADAQKAIGMYEEQIRNLEWKIEGLTIHGKDLATYGAAPEAIAANNDEIKKLKLELQKVQETRDKIISTAGVTKKRSGGIFGGLGDVFDGLGEEMGNIMSSSMLGSLGEWFGENGIGLDEITKTFDSALGTAGGSAADKFTSRIFEVFGLNETNNKFTKMGADIGEGLVAGLAKPLFALLHKLPNFLGGISDDEYYAYLKLYGFTDSDFYKEYTKNMSANQLWEDANGNPDQFSILLEDTPLERGKSKEMKDLEKRIEEVTKKISNATSAEEARGYQELLNSLNIKYREYEKEWYVWLTTYKQYTDGAREYVNTIKESMLSEDPYRSFEFDNLTKNGLLPYRLYGITNWSVFSNLQKGFESDIFANGGEYLAQMLYLGFDKGWLDNEDGTLKLVDMTLNGFIQRCKDILGIKSPSKVFYDIGGFTMEGFAIGIDENTKMALDSIDNATDLITDETIAGLNGMQYMLDNDITPTVTPVFDSVELQNGVDTINSALDSVQPRVDSAIGSFGIEQTDYTSNLATLQSRIEALTGVVDNFMTMIEGGAGVNVEVHAEADPANIYNLVVDANRTEFKRTGRNQLAY